MLIENDPQEPAEGKYLRCLAEGETPPDKVFRDIRRRIYPGVELPHFMEGNFDIELVARTDGLTIDDFDYGMQDQDNPSRWLSLDSVFVGWDRFLFNVSLHKQSGKLYLVPISQADWYQFTIHDSQNDFPLGDKVKIIARVRDGTIRVYQDRLDGQGEKVVSSLPFPSATMGFKNRHAGLYSGIFPAGASVINYSMESRVY